MRLLIKPNAKGGNNMSLYQGNTTRKVSWLFIVSILLIYPLPQVAIDIYLPSWPAMVHTLHASRQLLQLTLTIYVLFLGIAQLIYGPLSDRFGRRPILLVGITVFFISSFLCIFVDSIRLLLILRALQGLGIGCGFTVASAILADVFKGSQLAKMNSYSSMVYSLSLILAPVIGGYLQYYFGWQANFAVMAIYAVFLFALIYFFVHETKQHKTIVLLSVSNISKNYFILLANMRFMAAVTCLILVYGLMITFSIVGPFLLQENLAVSIVHYSQLLMLTGFAYFLGATLNSRLVKGFGIHRLIVFGLMLMSIATSGLLIATLIGWVDVASIIICVCLSFVSLGFVYPNCFAYSLDISKEKGYASALVGSAILVGVSVISVVIQHYHVNQQFCLSITFLLLTLLSIASYSVTRLIRNNRYEKSAVTRTNILD
jgi:DHA1 family 2-module integral membrane pump EmrD-like MFS transporter